MHATNNLSEALAAQAFQEKIEKQANGQGSGVSGLHKRGCHCKKSHCKKKYCECFQVGPHIPFINPLDHQNACLHKKACM